MQDLKISQLTQVEKVTGSEEIPVVINGTNKKVTVSQIAATMSVDTITNEEINTIINH